eukprot:GFUD01008943.1.p1 GENE.GFUD01008943.1~~GFUD01008943.1.p1  ORF type:complete len:538 (-),score=176.06 GFUD01008943.1:19-1632(-)
MKNKRKYPDQPEVEKTMKKLAKLSKVAKTDRPIVKEIKEKAAAVVESRKNANNIVDLIGHLELTEPGYAVAAAIQGVKRIFTVAIEKHELLEKEDSDEIPAEDKYRIWMYNRFQEVVKKLCTLLHHKKASVSTLALASIMSFLKTSWVSREKGEADKADWGQKEREMINSVILSVCSNKHQAKNVITRFQEFLLYIDVKFYFLKQLSKIISVAVKGDKVNPVFLENVLSSLEVVGMENLDITDSSKLNTFLCKDLAVGESSFKLDMVEMKKHFGNCWLQTLKCKINLDQYKRVLTILHDKVLPFLPRPLLLTDFLLSSYNVGGSISLLALSGVFTLISKHNLEYPEFYTKLYQLFTPEVLHVKYMARFFHLADIFLTSTHLPAYLVAAFTKRLARLCLTAPSTSIPMAIRFIHNLMFRHSGLAKMIDNPDSKVSEDPFDNKETDPAKCGALNSSLWEILSLQNHVLPQVSTAAKDLIEKGVRENELDVSALLETTWQEMFEKETKKKVFANVPTNWEAPDGLKMSKDDIWSQIFEIA